MAVTPQFATAAIFQQAHPAQLEKKIFSKATKVRATMVRVVIVHNFIDIKKKFNKYLFIYCHNCIRFRHYWTRSL